MFPFGPEGPSIPAMPYKKQYNKSNFQWISIFFFWKLQIQDSSYVQVVQGAQVFLWGPAIPVDPVREETLTDSWFFSEQRYLWAGLAKKWNKELEGWREGSMGF